MSTATASKKYVQQQSAKGIKNPVKNAGPANRKIMAKLLARIKDWAATVESAKAGTDMSGYHRPGSMQR